MKTTLLSIVLLTFLCSLSFAEDKIMTKWGRELKPDSVWAEYPRPQFQREQWTNLNGYWDYAIQPHEAAAPQ